MGCVKCGVGVGGGIGGTMLSRQPTMAKSISNARSSTSITS